MATPKSIHTDTAEHSPNTVFVYTDGVLSYLNPTGTKICELNLASQAIGKKFSEFAHPAYQEQIIESIEPFLGQHKKDRLTNQLWVTASGRVYYLDLYKTPIQWHGKKGLLVVANDHTSFTRAQKEHNFMLRANTALTQTLELESRMQALAELLVPEFADWCSIDIVQTNELKPIAVMHKDPAKIPLAKQLRQQYPAHLNDDRGIPHVLRTGETEFHPRITEAMLEASARDEKHLELLHALGLSSVIITPLVVRDKKIGVLTMAHAQNHKRYSEADLRLAEEIAARAAVAIENARLHQEVKADDTAKSDFLAILAHELRNPLAAMLSSLQLLLLQESYNPEVTETIHSLQRQTKFIKRLLDDLLDIARITRGEIRLKKEVVDIRDAVEAAVETTHSVATIRITHNLKINQPEKPIYIKADPIRIEQATVNLLTNSAKYTDQGGSITVSTSADQDGAYITISDTGIGLDPEIKEDLFKLFRRSEAMRHQREGLGVGLRLVKTIAELHGGWVKAESEGIGKGSTFTIMIPLASQQALPLPTKKRVSGTLARAKEAGKKTIIIVDDNKDAARAMSKLLLLLGHDCATCHNASEALIMLKTQNPDFIILDIGLPQTDGYTLAKQIRSGGFSASNTTLIALTGYGSEQDKARAKQAGFNYHLTKPVGLEKLKEILST